MSDIAQKDETNKSHYSELGWVVLKRVESLQQGYLNDSPQARADLAELRKASQDLYIFPPSVWHLVDSPESDKNTSSDLLTAKEQAIRGALWIYARHQRGRTTPMHQRGVNLGEAVSRLAWLEGMDNEKAVRRHFDAAVMSTTFSGFFNHLKGLIGQLGSTRAAIAIDYGLLAQDLYRFAIPGGRQKVTLSWARGYARQKNEKSETNSQTK
ncbi:type I-E CRISPR-associated protein Cse2/CasB [Varibaculum cambriense]|uniref:type I-E CRISPR-associated protein Cse2/CasB n=1 Tax=Varibaculum cambriense TaxID=184870 RepID=UPI00290A3C4A|nr:type I-E CRISPR-associated protein Cse2/CasB [Varibaculum cambriense]MDU3274731.1 type I-E CRISPR-associated protein Cse2/CasB [Varibaculum cambriense]